MTGLLTFLVSLVGKAFDLYALLIVARVVASWLDVSYRHAAMRFLVDVTEPVLQPVRRRFPPRGGLDFSPMIALVLIWVVRAIVMRLLFWIVP